MINEATYPVSIKPNDPGLLTFDLYHEMRNKENKSHDSDSYDNVDIFKLNNVTSLYPASTKNSEILMVDFHYREHLYSHSNIEGTLFEVTIQPANPSNEKQTVACIYNNRFYYDPTMFNDADLTALKKRQGMNSITSFEKIKHVEKLINRIYWELAINKNKTLYTQNNFLKRVKLKDQYFAFHRDSKYNDSIQVLNQAGIVVASASDEWGTTLTRVAKEYRGYRIGPVLGAMFIDEFNLPSGGYTPQGYKNSMKIWTDRVAEFIQSGWYSELIKDGRIPKERVQEIIKDYKSMKGNKASKIPDIMNSKEQQLLLYVDENVVILYDSEFLTDIDSVSEDHIHGYALVQDFQGETYIWNIDYDTEKDEYRTITTYAILQLVKDNGEILRIDKKPSDYMDLAGIKHVEVNDGKIALTQNVLPLDKYKQQEEAMRKPVDKYDEFTISLLELSDAKFNQ